MRAISTKWLPPTDTKPARIKAYTEGGNRLTLSWSECDSEGRTQGQAHGYAARKLADKMGWSKPGVALLGGGTFDGYVFVFEETFIRA